MAGLQDYTGEIVLPDPENGVEQIVVPVTITASTRARAQATVAHEMSRLPGYSGKLGLRRLRLKRS